MGLDCIRILTPNRSSCSLSSYPLDLTLFIYFYFPFGYVVVYDDFKSSNVGRSPVNLIREQSGTLRIYHRLDAAPSSVVFLHFSPVGSDELQSYGRIRERSIRFVGFGVYAPLLHGMEYTTVFFLRVVVRGVNGS